MLGRTNMILQEKIRQMRYSQTCVNDHLQTMTGLNPSHAKCMLALNYQPLNNSHLWTTTIFFKSHWWSFYTGLTVVSPLNFEFLFLNQCYRNFKMESKKLDSTVGSFPKTWIRFWKICWPAWKLWNHSRLSRFGHFKHFKQLTSNQIHIIAWIFWGNHKVKYRLTGLLKSFFSKKSKYLF